MGGAADWLPLPSRCTFGTLRARAGCLRATHGAERWIECGPRRVITPCGLPGNIGAAGTCELFWVTSTWIEQDKKT